MKKKALSLALALAMCLGLTIPAFAEEDPDAPMSVEEGLKNVDLDVEIGDLSLNDIRVEKTLTLGELDEEDWETPVTSTADGYYAIKKDTVFTISHTGAQDDGSYIWMYITVFDNEGDGIYQWLECPHRWYLSQKAGFVEDFLDPDVEEIGGLVELSAGQSAQFSIADDLFYEAGDDKVYELIAVIFYPQYDYYYWQTYNYFKVDEAAFNAAVAKGPSTKPEQPSDPGSTTPTIEVENIPASGTAIASTQTVTVDGKATEFQMYALADANGNLTNYIKLRDMAYVLNGTKAQFSVGYDGIISLTRGQPYEAGGTEMTTPYSGDRAYTGGAQTLKIDGKDVAMTAITLTDDNGGGYNYFKLRDLGKALGFNVSWDNGVIVESGKPYAG